ncbi:MAG TPA: ATP-binding protein, partial [Blastocatellia bacterium]|nr:ATP-binding protein [Blastocatellia bacterium]
MLPRLDSLRNKLGFSYGLLIVILLAVSAWGMFHFVRLGRAVDVILVNNYKSIIAAENMKEALDRQDSSAMFFLAGHPDIARKQFKENSDIFDADLRIAAGNITEPGEDRIVADVQSWFAAYRREVQQMLGPGAPATTPTELNSYYFERLQPDFIKLKARLDDLLHINQDAMVAASQRARTQSLQARISTAVVVLLGLGLAILSAWRFTGYITRPITALTEKARAITEGDYNQYIDLNSQDEIGQLAAEFNRMAARLQEFHRTDHWRLLMEQKKADATINSIYSPVIVTDARGAVTRINRAAEALFAPVAGTNGAGGDSEEAGSARDRILLAVQQAVSMQRPVASGSEGALVPFKVGGAEHSFRLRTTPMRDDEGRLLGAVTLLEDVSRTIEVDRVKSEFISVASQKLGEPLASLRLALYSVAEGHAGELSDKQSELLGVAQQNADQLDEIDKDLIELAGLHSGSRKMLLEPLRPVDLVRPAVERQRCAAEAKHVSLKNQIWSDLPRVNADKQAIKRVLDNLLSNAIRHTGRDGQIAIEAWERNNRVFFSVKDTGEGIPADHLPTIFGRFVRIKGRPGGGTGLGLALLERLIKAQEGQISVESKVGEGTAFTFALPVAARPSPR